MCICARARAGVPLRASPLSPFGKTLRSQFRGWDPSERRAGLHTRECTPSRAMQRLEHDVDGNRIACARTLAREPPNACANESLCHEDHEDMGFMLGGAQIETQHSWQCLAVPVRIPLNTCDIASIGCGRSGRCPLTTNAARIELFRAGPPTARLGRRALICASSKCSAGSIRTSVIGCWQLQAFIDRRVILLDGCR